MLNCWIYIFRYDELRFLCFGHLYSFYITHNRSIWPSLLRFNERIMEPELKISLTKFIVDVDVKTGNCQITSGRLQSRKCPCSTTPWQGMRAPASAEAKSNALCWPALCTASHASCSWTRPPVTWMLPTRL